MSDLLKTRNQSKAKKPRFRRGQAGIMPQLKGTWRRPRGLHNKMRLGLRGKPTSPAVGYSSPKAVKGLERSGLKSVVVKTLNDLQHIKANEGILLSATLGMKKRTLLLKKATEMKLTLLNIKNPEEYLKQAQERIQQRKKESQSKKQEKQKAAETAEKKESKEDKHKPGEKHEHAPGEKHDHHTEPKEEKHDHTEKPKPEPKKA